jgi:long-subunit acyl-CoA synthetase (AMP-forming)
MENNKTFCQRVIESCEKHSAKTAMRIVGDEAEIYSYGELLKQVRSVSYRIAEEKIEFGDRVALIGENHPCWAIAYLGTLFAARSAFRLTRTARSKRSLIFSKIRKPNSLFSRPT